MIDRSSGARFSTIAIHAGAHTGDTAAGAMRPFPSVMGPADHAGLPADMLARLAVGTSGWMPSDQQNVLEERIAALEAGSAALACASGPMAWLVVLQTLMQPGDEVVASRSWGGSPFGCRDEAYENFGWRFRWAEVGQPENFVEALSDKTKAIVVESVVEADGSLVDIEAIARVARRARVPLIVDNTLATPCLIHPLEHGADIVLHWTAAYLGAHPSAAAAFIVDGGTFDWVDDGRYPAITQPSRSCAGLVIGDLAGNFAFALACRFAGARDFGAALSPAEPSQILHGIETLPLRVQRHSENALAVAHFLAGHAGVRWVRYAGLEDDPAREVAHRYCPNGASPVVTFAIDGGSAFLDRLKLTSRSSSRPARTTARLVTPEEAAGREPAIVRLAVGLEDQADILADLDQALAS